MTCMSNQTSTNGRGANFRAKTYQGGLPPQVPHRADRPGQLRCQCAPHQRLTVVRRVAVGLALAAVTFFIDRHHPVDQRPGPPPSASKMIKIIEQNRSEQPHKSKMKWGSINTDELVYTCDRYVIDIFRSAKHTGTAPDPNAGIASPTSWTKRRRCPLLSLHPTPTTRTAYLSEYKLHRS